MPAPTDPGPDRLMTHAETAMGTVFSLSVVPGRLTGQDLRSALGAACATLHHADAVFSTWDRQSPVSRLRRGEAVPGDLPSEVAQVMAECQAASQASGGWFDPWAMPGGFDPTGLVKGWAVERALAVLRGSGIAAAMVNGGGDLAAFGSPAPGRRWRVGIRHPWRAGSLAGIIEVGAAVATSGSYERGPTSSTRRPAWPPAAPPPPPSPGPASRWPTPWPPRWRWAGTRRWRWSAGSGDTPPT